MRFASRFGEARAAEAGVSLEEFLSVAESLAARKLIGRFSTFLEHVKPSQSGTRVTRFNALFHWAVPRNREIEAGGEIGRHEILTHCYWREAGPEFNNVNIMGVAHGTEKERLLEHKEAIDHHLKSVAGFLSPRQMSFGGGRSGNQALGNFALCLSQLAHGPPAGNCAPKFRQPTAPRSARLIFPRAFSGISSKKPSPRGTARLLQIVSTKPSQFRLGHLPCIQATTSSPRALAGTPSTTASRTFGDIFSTLSTSSGFNLRPATFISSEVRPTRTNPSPFLSSRSPGRKAPLPSSPLRWVASSQSLPRTAHPHLRRAPPSRHLS